MEDELERHHRELTHNLRHLDVAATKAKWARENPGRIAPPDEAVLAGMHKARLLYARMNFAEKVLSAQWLDAHGYSVPEPYFGPSPATLTEAER